MFGAAQLGVGAHVAAQVHYINVAEFLRHRFAEAIEGAALDKAAVGDKSQHAVLAQAVARPAEEARVHVVELGLLRGARVDVGVFDALVYAWVFAVLVVVVFVGLVGVVRWVADNHADALAVLPLDARDVLLAHAAENIRRRSGSGGVQTDVIQRIDKTQIGKFFVVAGDRGVGGLDVQVGDVVGQDRHLVRVQLLQVFVFELGGLAAEVFQQFADKGAGSGGGVENFHVLVDQVFAEVFFGEPVRAVYHEAHDFVRCVHHAQPVCRLGVIDLVKVFVDDLEESLLLVVAADLRGSRADRGVVGLQPLESLFF